MLTKKEYLLELANALKSLPAAEQEDALAFYEEYLNELSGAGEELHQALGSPKKVAKAILAEYTSRQMEVVNSTAKKSFFSLKTGILLIFASPIALPLALGSVD